MTTGARSTRVLVACREIVTCFLGCTRWGVEDRSEYHCYAIAVSAGQAGVAAQSIVCSPDKNHLLLQFPTCIQLRADLIVKV